MDKQSLKDLKDATPEDRKVAADLEQAEREQGIPHPAEAPEKEGGPHGRS